MVGTGIKLMKPEEGAFGRFILPVLRRRTLARPAVSPTWSLPHTSGLSSRIVCVGEERVAMK